MKTQKEAAKQAMIRWLANERELGKAPSKIECAFEFDLHGLHYYGFRFKKKLFGDWLLGVAGGYEAGSMEHCGHVFSDFEPYQPKTAVDSAIELVERIRQYWMQQARQQEVQQRFQENLRYISQTELSVDTIERQFVNDAKHHRMLIGNAHFPTGRIVTADPLAYLPANKFSPELEVTIPKGSYPVEVAIYRNPDIGIRMCTTRLMVKDTKAVRYECAAPTRETAVAQNETGLMSGFPVDAGMMTICDAKAAEAYREFLDQWYAEHPDQNHYDHYFADFFAESYEQFPAYQRECGDFILWDNPLSHRNLVMVASGFGDGFYQSYIGYDQDQEICQIVVPMIDPALFEEDEPAV